MITEQLSITLKNPIVCNHKAYGQDILPGLAYIDLIYQIFREHGFSYHELELRNLSIYHPLIVGPNEEIMLNIQCRESQEGQWRISIDGQVLQNGAVAQGTKQYVTAEMFKRKPVEFEETLNLQVRKQSAKNIVDLDEIYEQCQHQELMHTGFMKAIGQIYDVDESVLIDLSVGPDASSYADVFMFHPTLMDASGIGSNLLLSSLLKEEQRLYLPLFYESFCASELLQTRCITRVQSSSVRQENELIYLTFEFFNESGKKIAELKNFASKLVRGAELINPNRQQTIHSSEGMKVDSSSFSHPNVSDPINKTIYNKIERFLRQLLAERLQKSQEQIESQVGYYEMGLDSPGLLQVVEAIENKIGVSLSPTLLFEYTTIAELSTYLVDNYSTHFSTNTTKLDIEGVALATSSMSPDAVDPVISQVIEEGYGQKQKNGIPPKRPTPTVEGDIAIIGMAGRYPQASNIQEFWNNLKEGKDCITEIPASRWDWQRFEGITSPSGKSISKWGGFIDAPDCFDPQFFRISPREAETMDPQERLFLETCWETIEDAGYTPKTLTATQGRNQRQHVGVFVGVMHKDYSLVGAESLSRENIFPLSLNYAQIANRVSYYCNFHGPSMAVDTVCSSSLTAVHLALESIRHGECEVALAGGVNLSLNPDKYISYGDMHSTDGYCRTFGKGGDGYVSGEGVGAVLLKPLHKAVEDGDQIYAVIKGSTINHVGTVSGMTVPSPVAQADLIETCLEKTGIDPRTISYVEAHGTGTSLGDPIEIQGLVKAFRQYTSDKQFCSLGSVKSNIGHAESAAGISGLSKVALQLHHKTLVPSLHSEELNPYLDLHSSPFYVQQQMGEWKQPVIMENGCEVSYPRRAGLSSFGASGSNVHIILEEYLPNEVQEQTPVLLRMPVIIPLSARNKERLQEYANKLLAFLHEGIHLSELAYTLQVGREAMEERVAFIVKDIPELMEKLAAFGEGKEEINDCWSGQIKHGKEMVDFFSADQDALELIDKWFKKGNLKKIAELWVKGLSMDWSGLYSDHKLKRISLPTYPFAKERYWVPEADTQTNSKANTQVLHPLLHQNTSDFSEQRFSSTFTGQEFFLSDHVVKGKKILPGVAYLEMVRAAVEKAVGAIENEKVIRLNDIVWIRPIVIGNQPVEVHIGLYPEDHGEITYEVYSKSEEVDEAKLVHSQGSVVLGSISETLTLDIQALLAECNQTIVTSDQCYTAFKTMGLDYGPGYQGIEKVYVGEDQLLAKISLPTSVRNSQDLFVLHPSLMDSAFHASIGLIVSSMDGILLGNEASLSLPFAMQELEIFSACTPTMWSLIRTSKDHRAKDKIRKYDIDLCDENGKICVRMKGASIRALEGELPNGNINETVKNGDLVDLPFGNTRLFPSWEPISIEIGQNLRSSTESVVVLGGTEEQQKNVQQHFMKASVLELQSTDDIEKITQKLQSCGTIDHVIWIAPDHPLESLADDRLIEEQDQGVVQVFKILKAILQLGYGDKHISWSMITTQAQPVNPSDKINPIHASVHGFAGTLAKEYTNWKIRIMDLEEGCHWPLDRMFILPTNRQGQTWAYRNQRWYQQQLIPFQYTTPSETLYKPKGVYVVIGGAGYIGEAWSEYMIRTYQAQMIWIGRSQMNAEIQSKLDRLATLGPAPQYIEADATNLNSLHQAYKQIKEHNSRIDGIVHSAMVLTEQSLENMEVEEFKAGLAAKIDVSVRLAQVFQKETLDFVMFFSSLVAYIKNVKQSHYASGCTFEDAFAYQLSNHWTCPVKVMNWGYWGNGEVAKDQDFVQLIDQIGLGLIQPQEGMEALEVLLSGPVNQMALINTTKPVAIEGLNPNEQIAIYSKEPSSCIQMMELDVPKTQFTGEHTKLTEDLEMNELLYKLLLSQLQSLGLIVDNKIGIGRPHFSKRLQPLYGKWLEESLAVLVQNHYLKLEGDSYTVVDPTSLDLDTLWKEWELKKLSWMEDRNMKAMVVLVDATLKALPDILTGKVPATDIMFPNSSMELVEGIYKQNQVADYFNEVLADTLVAYIQERVKQDPDTPIRIMEIGAGTGGTSATVFRRLKPYQVQIQEYCYTDLSKAFLMHAEKEYGWENPYVTYQIFNVEEPIAGQGIEAGGYDVVIAANVLHATKNIRETLRNAKAVLKNGGCLLLNEMAGNSLFTHLTFGLLEGWWLVEDPELRIPGCPGLYPENWKSVLENEGFHSVFFPAQENHSLSHQIVVAESDGVIRQKQLIQQYISSPKQNIDMDPKVKVQPFGQKKQIKKTEAMTDDWLREKSTAYFAKLIGETLKIPVNRIDSSDPLENYGIDSIIVVQLTNTLRKVLDNVSSTLFFEYHTIDALVEYFINNQKNSLMKLIGLENLQNDEEMISQNEVLVEKELTDSRLTFRKSRRYLKVDHPAIEESTSSFPRVRDIAIIGISGRYAQANTVVDFWNHLKKGKNCITEIPKDRWDWKEYFDEKKGKKGSIYTKWGGFIEDFDKFDPSFFQIPPVEAEKMDPQERVFLETAYASMEDAGYTPATLSSSRKVGVFTGVMNKNYPTGYGYWSIANRVSYLFNFQGPSLAVDTACSSSLTAIHLALESLYSGTSECAIAGGVNLIVDPIHYLNLTTMTMLSSGDKCKSFGDQADGFVDGEGVGAIVLKPLHQAIADGDHIYGVIKGSMMNAGGKTNGYTVPNPNAQSQLIAEVLQRAGVPARTVSYLEAHGTGTALGDPIEISGLTKAFEQDTQDRQFCAIGSVKSNIGHCESAAGIAGVTKVLFQLKHQQLVPSLHSEVLNPNIDFKNTPFIVQQELAEWKRPVIDGLEVPRRAGISSFGAGGANVHLVIEEYIPKTEIQNHVQSQSAIIVLSAKNEEQLQNQVERLLTAISEQRYSDTDLTRIAYTLQTGREAMEHRLGFVVSSMKELEEKLKEITTGREYVEGLYRGQTKQSKDTLAAFVADEDTEKIIDAWISKGKYKKLLDVWVKGLNFDWNQLYGSNKPIRISLPTYPFARERYWMPQLEQKVNRRVPIRLKRKIQSKVKGRIQSSLQLNAKHDQNRKTSEPFELMTFSESWREEALQPNSSETKIKTLVCFLSDPENQKVVVEAVQDLDQQTKVIFISQGTTYKKESPYGYCLVRHEPSTYVEAFKGIQEEHGQIDGMLYLWALEDPSCIQDYSCIVYVLQSIMSAKMKPHRLLLAGQFDHGLDRSYLESWIGFERSLGLVLPNTKVSGVYQSVSMHHRNDVMKDWLQKLWAELQVQTAPSVLYQEKKRYVYKIEPTTIQTGKNILKLKGTYLITGGCGGLGSLFAQHLAKQYSANLILTGRSPINRERQNQIQELERLGSQVMYVQADVCDLISMKEALGHIKERFGVIHGVIHAAGIQNQQSIFEKDMQSFEKVIGSKINGTRVLDELLQEEPLDFVCYFSSSSAILGDFGTCDYAIGNRFQMAYAHYRNEQPHQGKTIVINWPVWEDGGMEVGDPETTQMYLKSSGQRFLETEEGIDIFERILSQNNSQHLVLVGEHDRAYRFLGLTETSTSTPLPIMSIPPGKGRRAEMEGWSVEQCLEWDLKDHINKLLKISKDKLELDKNWADFGFDSIHLAEFAVLLTKHYEIEITPALFFGYSNLRKLIHYFMTDHREKIQEFYREGVIEQAILPSVPAVPKTTKKRLGKPKLSTKSIDSTIVEPIAVIGMSGRFPQADTIHELWDHLKNGRNCISEIPTERWDWKEYDGDPHREPGKTNSKWGGFLKDIDRFDPLFFQISPKEAENMDPRQRIFLEEAWHTFEDAGYMGERIKGKSCGVYVGVEEGEYAFLAGENMQINGSQNATLAARIAYALDLKGPNLALTAACSSGLVAIHQACQALRQGDCEMALVGGVSLNISHLSYAALSKADMLSPDGKCRVFDQRANGLVPGEAVAAVLLKPLSKAISDQDHIYGCIKASGVNYDGRTNGITSPNPLSQAELIEGIYDKYKINPMDIQYVMAHSTGSKLGDPLEVQALTSVFRKYTDKKQFCTIGSIKPLIGHTFAASGVVSLMSMLMAMKDQTILGTYNCEVNNEYINFKESPFTLTKENQVWITKNNSLRMGTISSTGISGTNAHAVVEEYIPELEEYRDVCSSSFPQIIVLSAKNRDRLHMNAQQMLEYAELQTDLCVPNFAYTLQVGREAMECRLAIVVRNREELVQGLKEYLETVKESQDLITSVPIFTGDWVEDDSNNGSLLSGISGETILQVLLKEKSFDKVAQYWVNGGHVSWEMLHEGMEVRRVPLPTYPFSRERYWIKESKEKHHRLDTIHQMTEEQQKYEDTSENRTKEMIEGYIVQFLSKELNLAPEQMNVKRKLQDYGLDSIVGRKLYRHLEEYLDVEITGRETLEYRTIQALATYLAFKVNEANRQEIVGMSRPETLLNQLNDNTDSSIIEMMEQFTQGKLDFEKVQKMLEGKK
ncbi:SDR family NAD(P)-dependent oxidoreductase [Hazenella coriacea]|uniref:Polyketide synthase PksM n=1 Tax=Hazenella coriacea TaxID=1179467 RepID=A0A4R3L814_9BACL|nr:SDR family NAD(P)-dependent oxidoreductase [Hazenella coriacea]TCS93646.1 polyketide synthase PksM [Hazenella coriacea]